MNVQPVTLSDASDTALQCLEPLLSEFEPIDLAAMQHVSLLDRIDTKYLLGYSQLMHILTALQPHYRVLCIRGMRVHRYQTLYFDTPDFELYRQHHNGVSSRYKVRARRYVDSNVSFFEVKHKTNQNRTIKSRLPIAELITRIDGETDVFLDTQIPFDPDTLEPKLWNDYQRITLVGKQHAERVTLDINQSFSWAERTRPLPGLVIAEVKQDSLSQHSPFIQQMRRLGLRPGASSKYCTGVAMLYDHVKINNFKPQLRQVQQVLYREQSL